MSDFISGAILGGAAVLAAIWCGWLIAIKGAEKTRKEFEERIREESIDADQTREQRQVPEGLEDEDKTGHP